MGRQVNFFMTTEDQQEFLEFMRSDRQVGIVADSTPTSTPLLLDRFPQRGEPDWPKVWLWDRDHSGSPSLRYIKKQSYYTVDDKSEVIEFWPGFVDGRCLIGGRIWAESTYLGEDRASFVKKSEAFVKWFDRLARWIKRRSVRTHLDRYVLTGADAFVAQGGQLRANYIG